MVCRSKSGGAHVYCFLKEKAPAADMQDKLREIAAGLGYGGVEIFPKQREVLVDRGDIGSWLNMPYFEGDGSMRYAFDQKAEALSLTNFISFIEQRLISHEELVELEVPILVGLYNHSIPTLLSGDSIPIVTPSGSDNTSIPGLKKR